MRILTLYNRVPYPLRDGGALAVFSMMEQLRAAGHQVDLLCLNPSRNFINTSELPDALFHHYHLQTFIINTDITFSGAFLNLFSRKPYHCSRFFHPGFAELLQSNLQLTAYDLIVLEATFMGVYLPVIRKYTQAPVVLRAHNADHLIWERIAAGSRNPFRKLYLSLQARRLRRFELRLAASVNALVPISPVDAGYFRHQHIRTPIHVAPMGINMPQHAVTAEKPIRQIGFIGTFDWMPNLEGVEWFIREVWPLVQEKQPQLQFHLAGRKMPQALQRYNEEHTIIFGEVPDADAFLRSLQVFVVPLHSGSGIRIKLLEAMALGLPVVSTSVGAEGIPVVNGKHLLLADTPLEFAHAVLLIANDPDLGYLLGQESRKLIAEHYDIAKTGRELDAFYRDLVHA